MQGCDPSNMTKTTDSNNQGLYTSKCHSFVTQQRTLRQIHQCWFLSPSIYPVLPSMCYRLLLFPHRIFPTSTRQTSAVNCEKCQLQKYKVNNCWKSFIQISPLTGLSLSSSQGPTLEKAFSFSSPSLGIRWISAFLFACYLNRDFHLLCA